MKKFAGLYFLGYYHLEMEKLLKRAQTTLLNHIRKTLGIELPITSVNPVVALNFPQYLRYSFIALLVSFAESLLQELCIEVGKRTNLSEEKVKYSLNGWGKIKKSKKFLKDHLGCSYSTATRPGFLKSMDELFTPVLFLVRVRNCVLHSAGDILKLKNIGDKKEFQKGINKYPGFQIDNQLILLDEEFCKEAKKSLDILFSNLLTLLQ